VQQRKVNYKLYPNATERLAMEDTLGLHCRINNTLIEEHKRRYEAGECSFSFAAMCKDLTAWRARSMALAALNAQSLQVTAKRVSLAFAAFFRHVAAGEVPGFPRFKSFQRYAGWGYKAYGDGWKLLKERSVYKAGKKYAGTEYGAVRLSGIGTISMRGRARFHGTPKTAEVFKKGCNWYLSVTFNVDDAVLQRTSGTESMAFDWGITTLLTQIIGDPLEGAVSTIENPRWLRRKLGLLKEVQQAASALEEKAKAASGKESGFPVSATLKRLYARIRAIHGQVARQRHDFYHKLSAALVKRFGLIVTEGLAVANMTKRPKPRPNEDGTHAPNGAAAKAGLNRSILDAAPASLLSKIGSKAAEAGSRFELIPTKKIKPSQRCCVCGKTQKMPLAERTYACSCGNVRGRDDNAARTALRYAYCGAWWENGSGAGTVPAAS
jgi:putative transposase